MWAGWEYLFGTCDQCVCFVDGRQFLVSKTSVTGHITTKGNAVGSIRAVSLLHFVELHACWPTVEVTAWFASRAACTTYPDLDSPKGLWKHRGFAKFAEGFACSIRFG